MRNKQIDVIMLAEAYKQVDAYGVNQCQNQVEFIPKLVDFILLTYPGK